MKWLSIIGILLITCTPALAADQDPRTSAAISYLNRITSGELDLFKHTALSPNCSLARRKYIRSQLKFVRSNYLRQKETLSLESSQTKGSFAAVLIRAEHPSQPLSPRVHAIALIQRNKTWMPAPLPGSFANTGYGFDPKIESQVKSLERWMATEKIRTQTTHRQKARQTLQTSIANIEKQLPLNKATPATAVRLFIEQCRTKNLLRILATMGAASATLENTLETTTNLVSQGLTEDNPDDHWHLVTHSSCAYSIMPRTIKSDEVAVGFYNPLLRRQSKVLYFPINKQDGKTFVKLPATLKAAILSDIERRRLRWQRQREDQRALELKVPTTILKKTPVTESKTPEQLVTTFLDHLNNKHFQKAVELLPRSGKLYGDEDEHPVLLANLAAEWKELLELIAVANAKPSIIKKETLALASVPFTTNLNHGNIRSHKIWMIKSSNGWQLAPENSLKKHADDKTQKAILSLTQQLDAISSKRQAELSKKWLTQLTTLEPGKLEKAPDATASQTLIKQYRNHLRSNDRQTALSLCAVLESADSAKTLKRFNYALRGAHAQLNDDIFLGTTIKDKWTGLSVRTQNRSTEAYDYPLYLCVQTDRGHKILLDVDLRHPSNKGRKLLNELQWKKLKQTLPAGHIEDLQSIFTEHLALVKKDQQALQKLHE